MSRKHLSLHVGDLSGLARTIRRRLDECDGTPSHVEMLNLLAKAGGYKNFQHFKAEQDALETTAPAQPSAEVNTKQVKKAARCFDLQGRLTHWPKKESQRILCLWVLWSRLPARTPMSELDLDERLALGHLFCDHPLLRRWLVETGLVERTADCSQYTRVEKQPPVEALEVIRQV